MDIVTARGEIRTSGDTQCDVEVAGNVPERNNTTGCVVAAGGVITERTNTGGRVGFTGLCC